MAPKVRVHKLAKELGFSNDRMLALLKEEGIEVSSHLSGIDEEMANLVREHVADEAAVADETPVDEAAPAEGAASEETAPVEEAASDDEAAPDEEAPGLREIHLKAPIIVRDLAEQLGAKPNALIQELMLMKVFASINQKLEPETAEAICAKHDAVLVLERRAKGGPAAADEDAEPAPEDFVHPDAEVDPRPPVVAFLGHVDHGKTSLLDRIRNTQVTAGEAGGITQHVGASEIVWNDHPITFVDTPGHEAFTAMRARGAQTTDIVVLVVAADDGFMPQTIEALNHARAAGVAIIVALNKMDLPAANPDQVLVQMQQQELTSEEWGGETGVVRVSAETGDGIDDLLERIVLEAELLELKANAALPATGVVIESQLEAGLGPTVNVVVKNGTLRVGDTILCGHDSGRVKALIDCRGERRQEAGPSMPVKIMGLSGLPVCGARLVVCEDEKATKAIAVRRRGQGREESLRTTRGATIEELFSQIAEGEMQEYRLIVKTDVQGTCEAVLDALAKLRSERIAIDLVHSAVGAVNENDILLASASDATVVGFHVRVNPGVNKLAAAEGVRVRLFSIIYELIDEIRSAMVGMLEPTLKEVPLGRASILQVFELSKGAGKICGCSVESGAVRVGSKVRVSRDGDPIYSGAVASLRRFKDDVREVQQGLECGIRLDNFIDFEVGDIIDTYDHEEIPATL